MVRGTTTAQWQLYLDQAMQHFYEPLISSWWQFGRNCPVRFCRSEGPYPWKVDVHVLGPQVICFDSHWECWHRDAGNSQEDKDLRRMVGERSGSNCRWNCHNHGDAPEQDVGAGKQEYDGGINGKNESDRRSQEIVPNTVNSMYRCWWSSRHDRAS